MPLWWEILLIIAAVLQDCCTDGLRLLEVRVPAYVLRNMSVRLECVYDLEGEALYSVKWYKDGNEFYRYVPRDVPPAQTFDLPGINVEMENSSDAFVSLSKVSLLATGRFRCEVSGESPAFQTVTDHADMVVVALPEHGALKIAGARPRYQIGDWVRVNCTGGRSKPAVELAWFINEEPAAETALDKVVTFMSNRDGLETSILGLQFRVEPRHFRYGDMKLKCVSKLGNIYWRSSEESVEMERPQRAPALESRGTNYVGSSRADPVQANGANSVRRNSRIMQIVVLLLSMLMLSTTCLEAPRQRAAGPSIDARPLAHRSNRERRPSSCRRCRPNCLSS